MYLAQLAVVVLKYKDRFRRGSVRLRYILHSARAIMRKLTLSLYVHSTETWKLSANITFSIDKDTSEHESGEAGQGIPKRSCQHIYLRIGKQAYQVMTYER